MSSTDTPTTTTRITRHESLSLPSASRPSVVSVHRRQSEDVSNLRQTPPEELSIALEKDGGMHSSNRAQNTNTRYSETHQRPADHIDRISRSHSVSRSRQPGAAQGNNTAFGLTAKKSLSGSHGTSTSNPTRPLSHSPSILPHQSFFLPRRPTRQSQQGLLSAPTRSKSPESSERDSYVSAGSWSQHRNRTQFPTDEEQGPSPLMSEQPGRTLSITHKSNRMSKDAQFGTIERNASIQSRSTIGGEEVDSSTKASREPLLESARRKAITSDGYIQASSTEHSPSTYHTGSQPNGSNIKGERYHASLDENHNGDYVVDEYGRKIRNYERHEGAHRFFLCGRIMTSKDNPWPFIGTFTLALVLPIGFYIFNASWLWTWNAPGGKAAVFIIAYFTLVMWASIIKTSWSDPGIIPRNLDKPDTEEVACAPDDPENKGNGMMDRPIHRYLKVKDDLLTSKWCETCRTYRPPRTSHCRICDVCTEKTDHHCTFLNTCIARRNYTSFIALLAVGVLLQFSVIGTSVARIVISAKSEGALKGWEEIGSLCIAIAAVATVIPMSSLLGYHLRLLWIGRTTIEMLRPKDSDLPNVFAMESRTTNIVSTLCRPMEVPAPLGRREYARTG